MTFAVPLSVDAPFEADAFLAGLAGVLEVSVEVLEFLPSADERNPWSVVVRVPGPVDRREEHVPKVGGQVPTKLLSYNAVGTVDPRLPRRFDVHAELCH